MVEWEMTLPVGLPVESVVPTIYVIICSNGSAVKNIKTLINFSFICLSK